ncbi:hypothetical protein [Corynebacterium cystitidis]|uniref:Trypsin n=1 Tax=Corynebacterium cystitidis DSM 20524 TaxID=1121357 RepID=A0A1H9TBZ5_9CORY|nr:hypothetical protein [Corynebacterium cystitidis]WJY83552.1 hypothetical protein CCYS_13340 [Corynebacterium cystitidis DSM 20524]SER94732.1 hypothetical protein SAMN05661109_01408 [Corynebacterium cystitidis DSM 20524]SNV92135.1 putative secreted protein [Corynebacterium cystitidis]
MRIKTAVASIAAAFLATVSLPATQADASSIPGEALDGASVLSGHLNASAPEGTVVSQGDVIYALHGIGIDNSCTLGFIEREHHTAYTAGHCGIAGEPVFNQNKEVIGFVEASNFFTQFVNFLPQFAGIGDVARIRLLDHVVAGPNDLTGDTYVPVSEVRAGEPICLWGASSRETHCGTINHVRGTSLLVDAPGTVSGDSGGPAWIPGRGFVAVLSGWEETPQYGRHDKLASPDGL